jgi:hypothetical protein
VYRADVSMWPIRLPYPGSSGELAPVRRAHSPDTRACSLSRQVLLLVRCAAEVTRLWQRVEQNRFPRLREVSM